MQGKSLPGLERTDLDVLPLLFDGVEGWLWPDAGWFTAFIMNCQKLQLARRGGALEFGTYKGKYLSVLYHLTAQFNEPVVGIDLFKLVSEEAVRSTFEKLFGDTRRLVLVKADTRHVNVARLAGHFPSGPRVISIDAEHTVEGVVNDLRISHDLIADGGIVAVDDFTNVHCPGVTEGAIRFLSSDDNKRLCAFASCCNKLFLTTREFHSFFLNLCSEFVEQCDFTVSSQRFHTRTKSQNEQWLCGSKIWVISHTKGSVNVTSKPTS